VQRYIETVHGRGYRFMAVVEEHRLDPPDLRVGPVPAALTLQQRLPRSGCMVPGGDKPGQRSGIVPGVNLLITSRRRFAPPAALRWQLPACRLQGIPKRLDSGTG
jgi:hypothetical protein